MSFARFELYIRSAIGNEIAPERIVATVILRKEYLLREHDLLEEDNLVDLDKLYSCFSGENEEAVSNDNQSES